LAHSTSDTSLRTTWSGLPERVLAPAWAIVLA
jgi:hypothetical protein